MTRPLESHAALDRYRTMRAHMGKRPIPMGAWRGIAIRLEIAALLVPADRQAALLFAAADAMERWSSKLGQPTHVSYHRGGPSVRFASKGEP